MHLFRRQFVWLAALPALFVLPVCTRAQIPFTGNFYLHDPGTMIKDGTNYFIYGDGQGISGIKSTDLRNWSITPAVFLASPPAWTTNDIPAFTGYFWAPDIAYFNGRYNLYYAASQWGTRNSAIGVVTSPSLTSPVWTDQGKVVESYYPAKANTDTIQFNCIDPSILVAANGTVWMSYGSYSDGIVVTQINPTTGLRLNPTSLGTKVASSTATYDQNTTEGSCLYQRGGYYYLFLNYGGCCAGADSTYNIRVGRSSTVTGPYFDKNNNNMLTGGGTMLLESTARFIGPGHPAIMNDNGTNWFTYHYYDGNNNGTATVGMNRLYWSTDGWPVLTNDWSAQYTFDVDAREHLKTYNGTMQSGASIASESARGNMLALDGVANYVSLPNPVANASSFAAWVKWNGGPDWQRIFDFGSNTTKYFFLTPRANTGVMRFAIKNGGAEQQINAPIALPTNSWCHVAVTLDGAQGILYLNANPIATNTSLNIRPWQLLTKSNYLGKSQFPLDPYFSGRIDSFRVFSRALSPQEVSDDAYTHPALAHRYSFNNVTNNLVWDSIGFEHGSLMGAAFLTNGALVLDGTSGTYVNLPGGLVSGSSALTVEFWATFGVNGNFARVFDFGNISGTSGTQYFFYSPHNGTGGQRLEMKPSSIATTLDVAGTLDNRSVHVVCIMDPSNHYGAIYTNGVLEASMTASWPPLSTVSTAWSFLGRSLWAGDAYLNATIDELRIYDGRLTPDQIAADYQFGPDALALPITLVQSNAPGSLTLTWPDYAVGFVPESISALAPGSAWSPALQPFTLNTDHWQLSVPQTNNAQFFRLRR